MGPMSLLTVQDTLSCWELLYSSNSCEDSFSRRLSEQRVHDLLDGLCSDVSRTNILYTSEEGKQAWGKVAQPGWTAPSKPEEEGLQHQPRS